MKAVILAAGRGTRLSEVTKDIPKCLIRIGEKTILEKQIEILSRNSVEDIYVVIGYMADEIKKKIKEKKVTLIMNKEYATTDNLYSLYLARKKVKGHEFILLNGDTIFDEEIIKKIVNEKEKDIAPIDSKYYDLEELKIKEKNGRVVKILPKKTSKKESDGSTIGIFKFSSRGSVLLFDEIQECVKQKTKDKWFEHALDKILNKINMLSLDIHGLKWVEIDNLEDLEKAQELFGYKK